MMDSAKALRIVEALCLRFEGIYLTPYLCPAGIATIGVGSTRYLDGHAVQLTDPPITREHAMVLLRERIRREFMPSVLILCRVDTSERLGAITDFSYNLGIGNLKVSTLRKRINADRWADVPTELRKWNKGGGRVLRGLKLRREAEASLI